MNAVEIEEAISQLADQPFDAENFPYAFLEAFGNKETTIKRLRAGASNKSDLGGVLQTNNIHIVTCDAGQVTNTLAALKQSTATATAKAKFILATDGVDFGAEDLVSDQPPAFCSYKEFPDHFGFFLPLAGITTVRQISENAFDIRATSRMNRLYVELLKDNPAWGTTDRRHDMNHFMARLIFCFFAEDTGIFSGTSLLTDTIAQMSARDSSNTHEVIGELFRAMNTKVEERATAGLARWADSFPYVNGDLFSGNLDVPHFSRIARSYILHIGNLDWTRINPDIFGSMIQAVAEDEERGALGMHYTSVPNILKVLNPLFLDDLRAKLQEAGDNNRMLLNLRNRMARIRVFDPACGSGNFLVIAYKEMRAIEAEINKRRGELDRRSEIPKRNFCGIELRDFPTEIARLALVIAEYQCDVLYRGQQLALAEFLPLDEQNWIIHGNALRLDWVIICPSTGTGVKLQADDLFSTPLGQAQIDFENEGGETYISGNPQFKGARKQTKAQKEDLSLIFHGHKDFKDCDYVTAWYIKAADFINRCDATFAFVSTSSISEGEQVAHLWSRLYSYGCHMSFAHQGFKWSNNASNNAVVQCVIIGVSRTKPSKCWLYEGETKRAVDSISPYLIAGEESYVAARDEPICGELSAMVSGSMARDDSNLILRYDESEDLIRRWPAAASIVRGFVGSQELVHFRNRRCLWIKDESLSLAVTIPEVAARIKNVRRFREDSSAKTTQGYAAIPHAEQANTAPIDGLRSNEIVAASPEAIDDDELMAELAGAAGGEAITELRHVRKSADKRAAEEIANRTVCDDFDKFTPLFERVKRELKSAIRHTLPVRNMDEIKMAEIQKGEYFIVQGQIAYVAEVGEGFRTQYDRRDSRLRVIYDNGTESNLLMRSFQRALHRDAAGRLITNPDIGPLFAEEPADDDLASGTIYVLRSKSDHPVVVANREVLHKIGVTGGRIEVRVANAKLDPTFLMADVEVIATYELFNVNRVKVENLIHRVFDPVQVDIEIKDRFGNPVRPREWFLVPVFVVNEVVERIKDGTITQYVYDPTAARLVKTASRV